MAFRNREGVVTAAALSPDGRFTAAATTTGEIAVWDAFKPKQNPVFLHTRKRAIAALAFSPDGRFLASGEGSPTEANGEVRVWSTDSMNDEPAVLRGHESRISVLAFSPDTTQLVTGALGALWIWRMDRLSNGPIMLTGFGQLSVDSVGFSPNGDYLASGGEDSAARLWALKIDALVSQASRTAARNLSVEEWSQFFANEPYRKTFPELPEPCGDGSLQKCASLDER